MKKTFYFIGISLLTLSMGACSNAEIPHDQNKTADKTEIYTGMLPVKGSDGIRYSLHLSYDKERHDKEGEYHLIKTYIAGDTTSTTGVRDIRSFNSEGMFEIIHGYGDSYAQRYIRLTPDRNSDGEVLSFRIGPDSTLVLVNRQLRASLNSDFDYTLRLVK